MGQPTQGTRAHYVARTVEIVLLLVWVVAAATSRLRLLSPGGPSLVMSDPLPWFFLGLCFVAGLARWVVFTRGMPGHWLPRTFQTLAGISILIMTLQLLGSSLLLAALLWVATFAYPAILFKILDSEVVERANKG